MFVMSNETKNMTQREQQILQLLENGCTNQMIGEALGISTNTVKFHLHNIYRKLKVANRTQALAAHYQNSANIN